MRPVGLSISINLLENQAVERVFPRTHAVLATAVPTPEVFSIGGTVCMCPSLPGPLACLGVFVERWMCHSVAVFALGISYAVTRFVVM